MLVSNLPIKYIVMHYSATYPDADITAATIDKWHRERGWNGIGYHYFIRRDGTVERGRPESVVGAHVRNQNTGKIGICVAGGLERATGANVGVDNRTKAQIASQIVLTRDILSRHPGAQVKGHRDFVATQCPGYDAAAWWASVNAAKPDAIAPKPTPAKSSGIIAIILAILAAVAVFLTKS